MIGVPNARWAEAAVVFVAGSTDGGLFWSSDANGATIEGALRLTGLNNLGAFAQSDLT